jgi:hypothetical protein
MNDALGSWIRIIITFLLSSIIIISLFGYLYLSLRKSYANKVKRRWVGLLAMGLPFVSFTLGLIIWMLWNPLVIKIFLPLLFLGMFISFILYQSIISPYKLADWWVDFDKWLKNRK